jgi:hypothetical protein
MRNTRKLALGYVFQLGRFNYLAIQTGLFDVLAIGYRHQRGVIHHRHFKLGLVLGIDLVLIHFHIHLTHRAGRHDHIGAAVIGGFDNLFNQGLGLFRFGECQGAARASLVSCIGASSWFRRSLVSRVANQQAAQVATMS